MLTDGLTLSAGGGLNIRMLDDARRGPEFPAGAEGDLWELTEVQGQLSTGVYEYASGAWVLRNPSLSALTYDLSGTVLGKPDPGAKVLYVVAARTFFVNAAAAGAIAYAMQPPGETQDFAVTILRGDVPINLGYIRFEAGQTSGQLIASGSEPMRIQRGDAVTIVAPDVLDLDIADISFTICGYLAV